MVWIKFDVYFYILAYHVVSLQNLLKYELKPMHGWLLVEKPVCIQTVVMRIYVLFEYIIKIVLQTIVMSWVGIGSSVVLVSLVSCWKEIWKSMSKSKISIMVVVDVKGCWDL